jgi:CRP/FNR family cyclic AMP-dependent transcriptional regulator
MGKTGLAMLLREDLELRKTLGRNYAFRGLPDTVISTIAGLAVKLPFEEGERLVERFGPGCDVYILLEGRACIQAPSGAKVAEFGPGSIIGEISLVDQQPRSATVTATSAGMVAVIPIAALRGAIKMDPAIGLIIMTNIAHILCLRLRHMDDFVDAIGSKEGSEAGQIS